MQKVQACPQLISECASEHVQRGVYSSLDQHVPNTCIQCGNQHTCMPPHMNSVFTQELIVPMWVHGCACSVKGSVSLQRCNIDFLCDLALYVRMQGQSVNQSFNHGLYLLCRRQPVHNVYTETIDNHHYFYRKGILKRPATVEALKWYINAIHGQLYCYNYYTRYYQLLMLVAMSVTVGVHRLSRIRHIGFQRYQCYVNNLLKWVLGMPAPGAIPGLRSCSHDWSWERCCCNTQLRLIASAYNTVCCKSVQHARPTTP